MARPRQWQWSSAAAHKRGRDDGFVTIEPLLGLAGDWKTFFLGVEPTQMEVEALRLRVRTGSPLGSPAFLDRTEHPLGRPLRLRKRGP